MVSIIQEFSTKKWAKRAGGAAAVGLGALALANPEEFGEKIKSLGKMGKKWLEQFEDGIKDSSLSGKFKRMGKYMFDRDEPSESLSSKTGKMFGKAVKSYRDTVK